jgi:hypothetical protein
LLDPQLFSDNLLVSIRTAANFTVVVILATCCPQVLARVPDKTQPPTPVAGKGPVVSAKLLRKANLREESVGPSLPPEGPEWTEMGQKKGGTSNEFSMSSPNSEFSLKLTESPDSEADLALYNVALTWKVVGKPIPLGLATGAVISPDSHYIVLEPYWLIDVEGWREYDLRRTLPLKEGYFGVDRWSTTGNKFVVHFVECPFDCSPDESIEYWLVELGAAVEPVDYFPARGLLVNEGFEPFKSVRYSNQLIALEEPSLWERAKTQKEESYRFLWLRTFHEPIAIRVDINADRTARLTVKVACGAAGYDPGELTQNRAVTINAEETNRFLNQVQSHNFWSLSSVEQTPEGPDGADWIIEGVKARSYHVVDRWSPQDGDVRAMGLFMVNQLAKIKLPGREVY